MAKMKKKITTKLLAFGKKNKVSKILSLAFLFIYLLAYYVIQWFSGNWRRCAAMVCILLFFVASSSFSFAGQGAPDNTAVSVMQPVDDADGFGAEQTAEEEIILSEEDIIEDKDVMEGYENSEFEFVQDSERFSLDDILSENGDVLNTAPEETSSALSKEDWNLVLINKQHPVPDDYEFSLGKIKGQMECDERIIPELLEMLQAAKADGVNLVICSPYRDLNRQEVLFNRKINGYMKKGMSYLEAYQVTSRTVTVPGASEHQIGLALDIICDSYSSLNAGFGDTEAGKWLESHSCEYGFILRYPEGKEYITGIEYEPWHFRYAGKEAAMQMTENDMTLEEFINTL